MMRDLVPKRDFFVIPCTCMYYLVLANSCTKSCLRAGTMYTISSDFSKQTKSSRAGLNLGKKKIFLQK